MEEENSIDIIEEGLMIEKHEINEIKHLRILSILMKMVLNFGMLES